MRLGFASLFVAVALVLSVAGAARADVLVEYQFNRADCNPTTAFDNGAITPATVGPTLVSPDLLSTGLAIPLGAFNGGAGGGGFASYVYDASAYGSLFNGQGGTWLFRITAANPTVGYNAGNYVEITLTPAPGKAMSLQSIDGNESSNGRGIGAWAMLPVAYGGDGNFTHLGDAYGSNSYPGTNFHWNLSYLGANITGPVTIRISGAGDNDGYSFSDALDISGTTSPAPEPATMALLAVGGLAAVIRRRRR